MYHFQQSVETGAITGQVSGRPRAIIHSHAALLFGQVQECLQERFSQKLPILSFIDAVHTRIQPDVRPGTVAFATLRSVRHICNSARCFLLLVDARRIPRIRRVGALRKRFPAPSQVPSRVQDMV